MGTATTPIPNEYDLTSRESYPSLVFVKVVASGECIKFLIYAVRRVKKEGGQQRVRER